MPAQGARGSRWTRAGFHRILLGYDGSEDSEKAADLAVTLAKKFDATVIVCHAFGHMPLTSKPSEVRRLVNPLVERLNKLGITTLVAIPDVVPAQGILDSADEHRADLIILGSRGQRHLRQPAPGLHGGARAALRQGPGADRPMKRSERRWLCAGRRAAGRVGGPVRPADSHLRRRHATPSSTSSKTSPSCRSRCSSWACVIERLITVREKQALVHKLNMVVGHLLQRAGHPPAGRAAARHAGRRPRSRSSCTSRRLGRRRTSRGAALRPRPRLQGRPRADRPRGSARRI